ncbi:hypothetical protein Y032_0679g1464 [Ancylostoma ceylanicum]|uniref:Uncharacterized protein n=1 Tax=Ancylostoma ceylanicum TaxID=53326 RepID=A0A016WH00_9BILA|nr:hypothetical protein Y032_0679g1464 [Ancylostoma ceylanicum]
MTATAILVSLQVDRHSLCSSHICDVLTLYFTTHTSAPSRGFRLVLPLNRCTGALHARFGSLLAVNQSHHVEPRVSGQERRAAVSPLVYGHLKFTVADNDAH